MKLKLTAKLIVAFLTLGLIPMAILAYISIKGASTIAEQSSDQLHKSAVMNLNKIERSLFERYGDVQAFASNAAVRQHPLGSPESNVLLQKALNTYVKLYGIYPLSMVTDASGKVVAANTCDAAGKPIQTAFLLGKDMSKEAWFRDNRDGRFLKSATLDGTVVEDVARDPDAVRLLGSDALVIGYSAPITNDAGEFIGTWRNLADFSLVEQVIVDSYELLKESGLASTEFALIDKKGLLLAEYDPHHNGKAELKRDPASVLKLNWVDAGVQSAIKAVRGESGEGTDFHKGKNILLESGFGHSNGALGYPGLGWSLIVRIPDAELNELPNAAIRSTWLTLAVGFTLLLTCAILIARSITKPIGLCVDVMNRLAQGDLTTQVGLKREDEVGILSKAIDTCVSNLRELIGSLNKSATDLQHSAQTLTQTATTQAATAEETTVQSNTVASAGEELSVNAKTMSAAAAQITQSTSTVAAAMEEMSSSIQEVARNCANESEIARKADAQARQTRELMGKLDESARQIGKVVELINRIAEQTNLLALNATIEAASAGEAGRGFAVVANEVKELARQSAAATEDIRKQVELIQGNTGASIKSLEEVGKIIEQVSQISSSIAAAVEEQSATTSEIVGTIHGVSTATGTLLQNVQQTAEGAAEVARNIAGVSTAADDGAKGAALISTSANELNGLSITLSKLVAKFKI